MRLVDQAAALPSDTLAKIKEMLTEGYTYNHVVRKTKVSKGLVIYLAQTHGIGRKTSSIAARLRKEAKLYRSPAAKEWQEKQHIKEYDQMWAIIKAVDSGMSQTDAARLFKVSTASVNRTCKYYDVGNRRVRS